MKSRFLCLAILTASLTLGKDSNAQQNPNGQDVKAPLVQVVQKEERVNWGFVLFSDKPGKQTIRAKPLSLSDGKVTLKTRSGHVLTVALSQLSKPDQDLLSKTLVNIAKGDDVESTGTEFLKDALIRASESFPNETQVRREVLMKERKEEFHKKYDKCKFDLHFNITDVSAVANGYFLHLDAIYLDPMDGPAGGGIQPTTGQGVGMLVNLTVEDATKISKGDKLHIAGNVHLLFGEKIMNNCLLFEYSATHQRYGLVGTPFYFEKPTITIERAQSSSRLKDTVAARVAELRRLEAVESRKKDKKELGNEERAFQVPEKEAGVVGGVPPPPPPMKLEDAFPQPESYRVWADANGHRVEAALVEQKGSDVTLRKRDGKEVTLRISTLSREDLEWMLKEGK